MTPVRESGNPGFFNDFWTPACAGVTGFEGFAAAPFSRENESYEEYLGLCNSQQRIPARTYKTMSIAEHQQNTTVQIPQGPQKIKGILGLERYLRNRPRRIKSVPLISTLKSC